MPAKAMLSITSRPDGSSISLMPELVKASLPILERVVGNTSRVILSFRSPHDSKALLPMEVTCPPRVRSSHLDVNENANWGISLTLSPVCTFLAYRQPPKAHSSTLVTWLGTMREVMFSWW